VSVPGSPAASHRLWRAAGLQVPRKGVLDRRARHRHGVDRAPTSPGRMVSRQELHGKCLSLEWFPSRAEAKVIIEAWRRHNEVRPHSSLKYLTPNEFVARGARPAPRQATGRTLRYMGTPRPGPLRDRPVGTRAASEGSYLKLTVVRRTRAGHDLPVQ
jgi:Integrase core domain